MEQLNSKAAHVTVLSDSTIQSLIKTCSLVTGGSGTPKVRSCSVDLTVGTLFWESQIIPFVAGQSPRQIVVPPGGMVGMFTAESLKLPSDVCGTAFAINAQSSEGLLVLNPGHVDPGFEGPLTVKALNIRRVPFVVQQGEPIFTVVFSRLDAPSSQPYNAPPADQRARTFNVMTVEKSADSLSKIIEVNKDGPFPGREEVEEMIKRGPFLGREEVKGLITKHWSTLASVIATVLAVVLAALAAWASFAQLARTAPATVLSNAVEDSSRTSIQPAASVPAGSSSSASDSMPQTSDPRKKSEQKANESKKVQGNE